MMRNKVLKLAEKGGFENVAKLDGKWKGYDVYHPIGQNGETLYIGAVYFLVKGDNVRAANYNESEKISDFFSEPSDYCD